MDYHGGHDTFVAAEVLFAATVLSHVGDGWSHAHFDPHSHAGHGPQHGDGFSNRYYRFVGGGATGPNRPVQPTLLGDGRQVGLRVSCVMSLDGFNPASMLFIDDLLVRVNKRLFAMYRAERWNIGRRMMPRRFGLFVMTNAYVRGVNPAEPNVYFTHLEGLKSLNAASEKPEDYLRPRAADYKGAIGHTTRGVLQFGLVELDDRGQPLMVENIVRSGIADKRGNPTNRPGERINPIRMYQFNPHEPSARVTLFMDTFEFALMVPTAEPGRESKPQRMNVGGGEVNAFINCIPAGWYLNPASRQPGYPIQATGEVNLASRVMAEELFEMLHAHPFTTAEQERRLHIERLYNNGLHSIRNTIELGPNPVAPVEPAGRQSAAVLFPETTAGAALGFPSGVVAPPETGKTRRP